MTMQQALGAVGFVVGAYFGYPQLGFVVGSLVGAALTPKTKIEGPKLDDLKVQVSTYGAGIPKLWGTFRIAPNVIWSTDKYQEASVEEQGGKGGGTETTTYRTFVDMRQLICQTPADGSTVEIVKFFIDGKLQWDNSSGISMGSAMASAENPLASFIVYQGEATQLPDSNEEAYEGGPGSVPAYRGVVSIAMRHIECPNGRVPQFSYVCSTTASAEVEKGVIGTVPNVASENAIALVGLEQTLHISEQRPLGGPFTLSPTIVGYGYTTVMPILYLAERGDSCVPLNGTSNVLVRDAGNYSGTTVDYFTNPKWLELIDLSTGIQTHLLDYVGTDAQHCFLGGMRACFDTTTSKYAAASTYDVSTGNVYAINPIIIDGGVATSVGTAIPSGVVSSLAMYGGVLAVLNVRASNYYIVRYDDTGAFIDELMGPSSVGLSGSQIIKSAVRFDANGLFAWVPTNIGASVYYVDTAWHLLCDDAENIVSDKLSGPTTFYADQNVLVIGPSTTDPHSYDFIRFRAISTLPYKVKDIISAECEAANETRYDVSGIPDSDTLIGYATSNPASARVNIDPLLTAFQIFIVDEDGLIKFKKYKDIQSEADISYVELGQAEAGAEAADAMPLARAQEVDMPRSVSVGYIEPLMDYQTATEKEIRQVTQSTEDVVIELAMAINSDQAKRAAQTILYDRWRSQNTRSCKVSRKFAYLSPGDGVTIEYPIGTLALWRIMSMNDDGLMLELNLQPGDAELFEQTATGSSGYSGQEVAPLAAPTRQEILDIPILRDVDNNAGPYVALDSYAAQPADAELFVGPDDSSLQSRGTVSSSAPIGFAETVLGDWTHIGLVDETNIFTVDIGDDVFSSCTRDVLLANGGEFWAYGVDGRWEIGSSAIGSSLGGGRYILSEHLRGLFGTEDNTGNHQIGDTFVLLRIGGMLRPDTGIGGVGQPLNYRAITRGRSINSAASITFANTGEGVQPLRPINLRRSTNASNDITLTWDRRSRLAMNNTTGALPIGENSESYTVDFYSSGAFSTRVGSLTSTVESLTITSGQQTLFGLTPGAAVNVRVHQNSDSVGPSSNYLQQTI